MGEFDIRANESIEIQNSFFGGVESSGVYRHLNTAERKKSFARGRKSGEAYTSFTFAHTRFRGIEHNFLGKSN